MKRIQKLFNISLNKLLLLNDTIVFPILKIFLALPYYLKSTHFSKVTVNLNPGKTEIRH